MEILYVYIPSILGEAKCKTWYRSRPKNHVVLTTNLLIALSRVWRVPTNIALVRLYTICSHPYEHELCISFQYQHFQQPEQSFCLPS